MYNIQITRPRLARGHRTCVRFRFDCHLVLHASNHISAITNAHIHILLQKVRAIEPIVCVSVCARVLCPRAERTSPHPLRRDQAHTERIYWASFGDSSVLTDTQTTVHSPKRIQPSPADQDSINMSHRKGFMYLWLPELAPLLPLLVLMLLAVKGKANWT